MTCFPWEAFLVSGESEVAPRITVLAKIQFWLIFCMGGFLLYMKKIKLSKKPKYIKLTEDIDYLVLFKKIEQQSDTCFLLESLGEQGELSRYVIIGFDPSHIIRGKNHTLFINEDALDVENPYYALRDLIPQDVLSREYAGGLVGYLGYDAVTYFEPSLSIQLHPLFDQFMFGIYTDGIVFDKVTNECFYFYYDTNRFSFIQKIMQTCIKKKKVSIKNITDTVGDNEHKQMLLKVREEIISGHTFQCEIGLKTEFTITGDSIVLYERLRKINPSPFMYFIKFGDKKIIGASPEMLFGMRNSEMSTFPLAGTIKRGKTKQEDQELARKLLNDKKERAEHVMLVDLHRNDIGRVARFGSVKIRNLMDIKRFSHVQHISSEIVGLLNHGEDMFSALAANFPAGTLSGSPKIESMKIIERLEQSPRGPYGGAVGHFGLNGDCTFAIPIRTLFIAGSYGFTQAASGIVYDSVAESEYDELHRKLAPMKEVLSQ